MSITKKVFENDEMVMRAINFDKAPSTCELCGSDSELRPYGPFQKWVCFKCGMENETITEMNFAHISGSTSDNQ
jgi:transposase-like protein